jgi:ribosomal protection tetracycline resistance protein
LQHRTLNLGILAHVDAGKTTLTERLLYAAGVIDELGSVDHGNTQTDTLALERQRGITIKSAVVSFAIDDVTVNLIDTPGHPDFIAEVERVLGVLDGAVLVLSAVEGVQPQTRILMRALERLRVPTLLFVNKIDRRGAQYDAVLRAVSERLTRAIVPMGLTFDLGGDEAGFAPFGPDDVSRLAEAVAEHDDELLAAYVEDEASVPYARVREALAHLTAETRLHPVFFGSAKTGAGVDVLRSGIAALLPAADGDREGPVSGTVFKVERGAAGEKIGYVRMFSGTLRTRDRLGEDRKVTAIEVFDRGSSARSPEVSAGGIAKLWGLGDVRIGDPIGDASGTSDHLRAADVRDGRRPAPQRRQSGAAHRADAARGAGPAHRRAPRRGPPGAVCLALRRGAEGGHRGDARGRFQARRRVPRDDDDLRRARGRRR